MPSKSKKINVRDKLDGEQVDLSMLNLTDVPVKEIAALPPRATRIDLSNNQLTSLSQEFASTLTHITHLELGSNKLKELPENIGLLANLKYLDLYNNQITDLPISFCHLKNLKWLDVKGNSLKPELQSVAGDCLNQRECESAAHNIVEHLKMVELEIEREQQRRLQKEKDKEAHRLRKEEEERRKKKAEKKAAKEKKRAEFQQAALLNVANGGTLASPEQEHKKEQLSQSVSVKPTPSKQARNSKNRGWSLLGWMNIFLVVALLASTGLCAYIYTGGDLSLEALEAAYPQFKSNAGLLLNMTSEALQSENLWQSLVVAGQTTKRAAGELWNSLQMLVGDLSPYTSQAYDAIQFASQWIVRQFTEAYHWIVTNVDWNSILSCVQSAWHFIKEQCQVLYEELGKNEALVSVGDVIWRHTEWLRETFWEVYAVCAYYILNFINYIHMEGPNWVALIQEQATLIYNSVRESVKGLVQ